MMARYSSATAAVLAFISSVVAQTAGFDPITTPTKDQIVPVGADFNVIWTPSGAEPDATVSIKLLQGATPSTLSFGPDVAANVSNNLGRYTWSVPCTLGEFKTYGIAIFLDSDPTTFQYSFPFHIGAIDNNDNNNNSNSNNNSNTTEKTPLDPETPLEKPLTASAGLTIPHNNTATGKMPSNMNVTQIFMPTAPATTPTITTPTSPRAPLPTSDAAVMGRGAVFLAGGAAAAVTVFFAL